MSWITDPANPAVTFVEILGAAGSGKTTLVRELYHRMRFSFYSSSFLCDVADSLQVSSQLLKDLASIERKFNNTGEVRTYFRNHPTSLNLFPVLVVLDGIEQAFELISFFRDVVAFGPDSLIIVASCRESHGWFYNRFTIWREHELKGLASEHAEELFCHHAFQQPRPIRGFEELVRKALGKCEGLPLFIKLLSRHLSLYGENNEDDWKEEIAKIGKKSDILEVSYDALWEEEKRIFLDIACFFVGEDISLAMRIWDESGWRGPRALKTLEYKSLVEANEQNRLQMPDCVRDFGRAKATKQFPRRIWSCDPTSYIADQSIEGTEVRGIVAMRPLKPAFEVEPTSEEQQSLEEFLDQMSSESLRLKKLLGIKDNYFETSEEQQSLEEFLKIGQMSSESLPLTNLLSIKDNYFESTHILTKHSKDLEEFLKIGQMSSESLRLKLLIMKDNYFESTHILTKHSKDLVWLRCHDDSQKSILPSWSSMEHLRVLQVTGHHTGKLWQGEIPKELRELHCEGRLGELPRSIGSLQHLEKIVLDCQKFICSHTLPEEIFSLKSLQHMEIHCKSLRSLPNRFGELTSMQTINFSGCSELLRLPESFTYLARLQCLSLENCRSLKTLEHLILRNCTQMQVLPTQIRCQESLTKLDVAGTSLQELPASAFGIMSHLQVLRIGSPFLASLPSSIGSLFGLTHLELHGCTMLKRLPESLGQLNRLTHLSIVSSGVELLPRGVGRLRNLEKLTIADCPVRELTINGVRDFDMGIHAADSKQCNQCKIWRYMFDRLKTLRLTNTDVSSISIGEYTCAKLGRLDLSFNRHLLEVKALPNTLRYLKLEGCNILKRISTDFSLPNLRVLVINGCFELEELNISGCYKLRRIQGLENLPKLQVLNISQCRKLRNLSISEHLSGLEKLYARNCDGISSIRGLENLTKLVALDIEGCSSLSELSIPGHLSCLETLNASGCRKLVTLEGLENMANLRMLDINSCPELYELSIPALSPTPQNRRPEKPGKASTVGHQTVYQPAY